MMEIVRKLLSADEISPPNIRYDPDCDCFQTTFDGGTTWVDNPAADPRSAPQYQAPPPTGDDPRCDGAARMTALLKDSNDAAIHAVSVVQAYSSLFAVIALIFSLGVGLLVSLLIALADLIFSVGTTVVDDAFTDDVYDQIECITYCHLNAGGQFDDVDAWNAYQDEIGSTFGLSVVTTVLARMFLSFGFVTMNNAASLRTETGDCSGCDCLVCFEALYDFGTGEQYDWATGGLFENAGTWEGTYWEGHHIDAGINELVIARQFMDETEFCALNLTVSTTHGATFEVRVYNADATTYELMGTHSFPEGADHDLATITPEFPLEQVDGWLVVIGSTVNFQFMELWSMELGAG